MSLRRRFVLVLALFSVGLASLFGLVAWKVASDSLKEELDRRLLWTAGAAAITGLRWDIVSAMAPGLETWDGWTSYHQDLRDLRDRYVDDAFVFDATDNTLLVGADSTPIGTPMHRLSSYGPEIRQALRDGEATTETFSLGGRPYRYGFKLLPSHIPDQQSSAILAVLMPADFYAPLGRLRDGLLWGSVLALLVAVLLGGILATGIAQPLERLSRVALRIQRGRMDQPVEVNRNDEIGRLSRAMERMRQGIEERDEQLRLMLAQVAHEIRNPLGGLELFAAAAAETDDAAERRRLIGRVRREVTALNRIIDDFLTFARPGAPAGHAVDVREPVRAAVDLAEPALAVEGGHLEVDMGDEPLVVSVDAEQLKRAVLNLLRNAAQAGRRVRLEVFRHGSEVAIAVTDDGPGVPAGLRERIFEPFVTDKEKGAGLGLSIVRKVVEAQGGRVAVESAAPESGFGNGARFVLYLVGLEEPPPAPVDPGPEGLEDVAARTTAGPAGP